MLRELIFDDFDPADYAEPTFYNEFTGEHYPVRRAGDRYTGLPRGTDPMLRMQATRRHYLSTRALAEITKAGDEAYAESCRAYAAGDEAAANAAFSIWSAADKRKQQHLTEHRTTDVADCWRNYELARLVVMRPSSLRALKAVDMRAWSTRCTTRAQELQDTVRRVRMERGA
jgi:hypothetical protein